MGIPSYFVHIVKNYPNIIKEFIKDNSEVNNFYIDSNSIIYDAIRTVPYTKDKSFENQINKWVCERIMYYVSLIGPKDRVFIAFDGVSPVAKLDQQRNRRYKTWYTNDFLEKLENDKKEMWDTTAITPGSPFMKTLSKYLHNYFQNKLPGINVIISSSDMVGEGEHKIYQYIRDNKEYHRDTTTLIYGLDADLIMLSLVHLRISSNIYLFRETPHFISSINQNLKPNCLYVLDIYELDEKLNIEMHTVKEKYCTLDYIFMCFLLGNDFMPHFPALNIRTNGIQIILDVYNSLFNNKNSIISNDKIVWSNLRKLIEKIANDEQEICIIETKKRNKLQNTLKNRYSDRNTEEALISTPILDRAVEKYINIGDDGWQSRYYKELFDIDIDDERKKEICLNYLEGLEWNFKYYIEGCPDWRWCYKYKYPPLLEDLYKYIPQFDTTFIEKNTNKPVSQMVQLAYVLPRNSLYLLPEKIYKELVEKKPDWYRLDYKIVWAYCRYLWESHVDLPEIDLTKLEKIVDV